MAREITEAERRLLTHVGMFGSEGYPVRKLRAGVWVWGTDEVKGPPKVFKTKREATESFEAFLGVLHEALGEAARERATTALRESGWTEEEIESAIADAADAEVRKHAVVHWDDATRPRSMNELCDPYCGAPLGRIVSVTRLPKLVECTVCRAALEDGSVANPPTDEEKAGIGLFSAMLVREDADVSKKGIDGA